MVRKALQVNDLMLTHTPLNLLFYCSYGTNLYID